MPHQTKFIILKPDNLDSFKLIANWYFKEWNIPREIIINKLEIIVNASLQFQVLMLVDDLPISTGGIHHYIGKVIFK